MTDTANPFVAFPVGATLEFSERSRATMWENIEPTMTCWIWHGYVDDDGYGQYLGRPAHRVVYERLICVVPSDLELDHRCRNRLCVNPAHLDQVTHAENQRRSWAHRKSVSGNDVCVFGHTYKPNDFRSNGRRRCSEFARLNLQRRRQAARERRESAT